MKTQTTITNQFTGYSATIRTNGMPAIGTIRKHLRKSKAGDCRSVTAIFCEGEGIEIGDFGRGPELVKNGQYIR